MGFFARQELKATKKLTDPLAVVFPGQVQPWPVPCHIISEEHQAIRIDLTTGNSLLLHRCQLKFWGRLVDTHVVQGLASKKDDLAARSLWIVEMANVGHFSDFETPKATFERIIATVAELERNPKLSTEQTSG